MVVVRTAVWKFLDRHSLTQKKTTNFREVRSTNCIRILVIAHDCTLLNSIQRKFSTGERIVQRVDPSLNHH